MDNDNSQNGFSSSELIASVFKSTGKVEIRNAFMQEYPAFFPYLKRCAPRMTRSDEILCVLIILGFSTEDSAMLQKISPRSVNMARYRLRMRMELTVEQGLDEAVMELFHSYMARI